jgi:hypothetical protein
MSLPESWFWLHRAAAVIMGQPSIGTLIVLPDACMEDHATLHEMSLVSGVWLLLQVGKGVSGRQVYERHGLCWGRAVATYVQQSLLIHRVWCEQRQPSPSAGLSSDLMPDAWRPHNTA